MPPDQTIDRTSTHSVTEVEVSALGLPISRFKWVIIVSLAGLLPAIKVAEVAGLPVAAALVFGPALCVGAVQLLLQSKPPGWFREWLETRLTGGHLSPLQSQRSCLDD